MDDEKPKQNRENELAFFSATTDERYCRWPKLSKFVETDLTESRSPNRRKFEYALACAYVFETGKTKYKRNIRVSRFRRSYFDITRTICTPKMTKERWYEYEKVFDLTVFINFIRTTVFPKQIK